MDEWRTVSDARDYEVSRDGRVRNKRTGRVLKASYNQSGTPQVVLMDAGYRVGRTVPRLVKQAFD